MNTLKAKIIIIIHVSGLLKMIEKTEPEEETKTPCGKIVDNGEWGDNTKNYMWCYWNSETKASCCKYQKTTKLKCGKYVCTLGFWDDSEWCKHNCEKRVVFCIYYKKERLRELKEFIEEKKKMKGKKAEKELLLCEEWYRELEEKIEQEENQDQEWYRKLEEEIKKDENR